MKPRTILIASLVLSATFAWADDKLPEPAPWVPPTGISVLAVGMQKNLDEKLGEGLYVGFASGTKISLLVNQPDQFMIELDRDASKLEVFADDQKTDLLAFETKFGKAGLESSMNIEPTGHRGKIELQSPALPAAGASFIIAKGTLVVTCGSDAKSEKLSNVALKNDTKFKLAGVDVALKVQDRGGKRTLSFSSTLPLTGIRTLKFINAKGSEIPSRKESWGKSSFGNLTSYETDYVLDKKADTATLEVEYWGKSEAVKLPIDLRIGVSF